MSSYFTTLTMNMISSSSEGRIMKFNGSSSADACTQNHFCLTCTHTDIKTHKRPSCLFQLQTAVCSSTSCFSVSPWSGAATRDRPGRRPIALQPSRGRWSISPSHLHIIQLPVGRNPSPVQVTSRPLTPPPGHVKALYASWSSQTGAESEGGRQDELPALIVLLLRDAKTKATSPL